MGLQARSNKMWWINICLVRREVCGTRELLRQRAGVNSLGQCSPVCCNHAVILQEHIMGEVNISQGVIESSCTETCSSAQLVKTMPTSLIPSAHIRSAPYYGYKWPSRCILNIAIISNSTTSSGNGFQISMTLWGGKNLPKIP